MTKWKEGRSLPKVRRQTLMAPYEGFGKYLATRKTTDDPENDFVEDTWRLFWAGRITYEQLLAIQSWENVESLLINNGACPEAVAAGRAVWNEYHRAEVGE